MNKKALSILESVYKKCNAIFPNGLHDAYLYGSYARGDYDQWSDVDILLTVDLDNIEIEKYTDSVAQVSSDLSLDNDVLVSITVKPFEQFLKYNNILPYYKNVLKEGIRYAA